MKDAIGQEIEIGDTIVHCGGSYASANLRKVLKTSEKMIQVKSEWGSGAKIVSLRPDTVINVTSNIKRLKDEN